MSYTAALIPSARLNSVPGWRRPFPGVLYRRWNVAPTDSANGESISSSVALCSAVVIRTRLTIWSRGIRASWVSGP